MYAIHVFAELFESECSGFLNRKEETPVAAMAAAIWTITNTAASVGRTPAIAHVKIRAIVTCGFANIVLEVVIRKPPTRNPIIMPGRTVFL